MHSHLPRILSIVAVILGIGARIVDFGSTPPGLNQDEASIGYEAWSLLHYGVDRNGASWPVHLISWGSGQNALYAYMAMPFVAFGLSPVTTRLPMLLSAIASLWLIWFIARRLFDPEVAWSAAAIAALSPWHIMLARWGLESNLLPFVFLCGLACLVVAQDTERRTAWLSAACAFFGLCLYAYGTAYLAVPIFVIAAIATGFGSRILTIRHGLVGLFVFAITALPIVLFVAINTFGWDTVVLADMTVPRLPVTPRFLSQIAAGPFAHIGEFWHLLLTQRDGTSYNVTDPYGVLYFTIFFGLAIGLAIAITVLTARRLWPVQRLLLPMWLLACAPIGLMQQPNINRINLLLMGLVFCAGAAGAVLDKRVHGTLVVSLAVLVVMFGMFTRDYFSTQRERIASEFFDGLLPALHYSQAQSLTGKICVTGQVNAPYIYALFSERTDPRYFLRTVRYVDATAPFRDVTAFGRYTFGLQRCEFGEATIVVARAGESVPETFVRNRSFSDFDVYARR
jgi:hypothetical protein